MAEPRQRICVVEDNDDNRLLLQALLADDYELVEYSSGPEAIAGVVADPPDCVLLDISLPGMDGLEVLAKLRGVPELAGLPIIALTAHAMAGDRERLLAAGFDEYVSKPIVDEKVLLAAIASCLERSG
jgi:CheY-like chemotaxis protein